MLNNNFNVKDLYNIPQKNLNWVQLETMVKNGYSIDTKDVMGYTILHYKCLQSNYFAVYKLLVEFNADPNILNNFNETPLHIATWVEFEKGVELLIKMGAKVNCHHFSNSPLHVAVIGKSLESYNIVRLLLKFGADANHVGHGSIIPLHIAKICDNQISINLLLTNGAVDTFNTRSEIKVEFACNLFMTGFFNNLKLGKNNYENGY